MTENQDESKKNPEGSLDEFLESGSFQMAASVGIVALLALFGANSDKIEQWLNRPGSFCDSKAGYVLGIRNPGLDTYLLDTNRDGKADLYISNCSTPKGRLHSERSPTGREQEAYSKAYHEKMEDKK